jgi:hypothetical protein
MPGKTKTNGASYKSKDMLINKQAKIDAAENCSDAACSSSFACNISAMTGEERARWSALLEQLDTQKQEVRETTNGFAFRFPADSATILSVAEWITYERLCCPFFDFGLQIENKTDAFWLSLTGGEGVKDFIRSEFRV